MKENKELTWHSLDMELMTSFEPFTACEIGVYNIKMLRDSTITFKTYGTLTNTE